jgi:hypothetical protein
MPVRRLRPASLVWFASVLAAWAADIQWNVPSGDWATGANWSPVQGAGGPSGGNTFRVNNGGTAIISGAINGSTEASNSFTIGGSIGAGLGGTVIQSAGTLTGLGDAYIGANQAPGTYVMSGGTVQFNAGGKLLRIGAVNNASFASGQGTFHNGNGVSAGTVVASFLTLGNVTSGAGVTSSADGYFLNQGTVNLGAGTFNIGSNERASSTGQGRGTLVMEGGVVTAGVMRLGTNNASHGTVLQSGGTVNISGGLAIGSHVSSSAPSTGRGTYTLSGGTVNILGGSTTLNVGRFGQGELNVSGSGQINAAGPLRVGYQSGGHGTLNLSGGTIRPAGSTYVASTDGGNNLAADLHGMVVQTGGVYETQGVNGDVFIGTRFNTGDNQPFLRRGTWSITGGSLIVNGNRLSLGGGTADHARSEGTLHIGGSALVRAPQVNLWDANSVLTLSSGELRLNGLRLDGGGFTWGAGKLARYHASGTNLDDGVTDFSPSSTQTTVRYGTILDVTGSAPSLTTSVGSALDLGGLYIDLGARQDVMSLAGTLDLSATGDALQAIGNVYLLRGFQLGTDEYGSLPLVYAASIVGTFDTFDGGGDDGRGFTLLPTQVGGPLVSAAALASDTGLLQYAYGVVDPQGLPAGTYDILYFHYKVSASVPEPGTLASMLVGLGLLRLLRPARAVP